MVAPKNVIVEDLRNPYEDLRKDGYVVTMAPAGTFDNRVPVAIKEDENGKLVDLQGATLEELERGLLDWLDTETEAFLNGSGPNSFVRLTGENPNTLYYDLKREAARLAGFLAKRGINADVSQIENDFVAYVAGYKSLSEALKPLLSLPEGDLKEALAIIAEAYKTYILFQVSQYTVWDVEGEFEKRVEEAFAQQQGVASLYAPHPIVAELKKALKNTVLQALEQAGKITADSLYNTLKEEGSVS